MVLPGCVRRCDGAVLLVDRQLDSGLGVDRRQMGQSVSQSTNHTYEPTDLRVSCSVQVRIEGLTVVGQDVQINKECYINGAFILPHKGINNSIHTSGTIVM